MKTSAKVLFMFLVKMLNTNVEQQFDTKLN